MSIVIFIVGVMLFTFLVITHEYGHFIMARRNGVEVEAYVIYPPALYKRTTKAGWLFGIGILPLGAYVKLKGEHDSDTEPGTFGAASTWVKTKIMAAGVTINIATAIVLFAILAFTGMPQIVPNQYHVKGDFQLVSKQVLVTTVEPGSPAAKAGIKPQDEINDIAIPGRSPVAITSGDDLIALTPHFAGKKVLVYYTRAGHHYQASVQMRSNQAVQASIKSNHQIGYLGLDNPVDYTVQRSTWSSPIVAIGLSGQLVGLTFQGIGHALGGLGSLIAGIATGNNVARQNGQSSATNQLGGPIAIFYIMKNGSLLGLQFMLFIIAYLALILGFMNLLPIPALDGGRLWLMLGSRVLKKPISPKREEAINATGFLVLITLVILISIVDIQHFILHH